MPRRVFSTSIAGGASFDPFADYQYRYLPWPARVRILAWTTATGVTNQVRSGSEEIQVASPVPFAAAATKVPSVFEVDPLDFAAPPGDLVSALFTNTPGAPLTVTGIVDVNPR